MTTTYTGECPKCGHEQTREWKGEPWRGPDGETSFAADCHRCGPGTELEMFPEEPEGGDETVEVWSLEASWNGKMMVVERSLRTDDALDAVRAAKLKEMSDAMDEAEAWHRANPVPVLVDRRAAS